ncbi:MAG: hypothetical protein AABW99_04215, partial [archaeon]
YEASQNLLILQGRLGSIVMVALPEACAHPASRKRENILSVCYKTLFEQLFLHGHPEVAVWPFFREIEQSWH